MDSLTLGKEMLQVQGHLYAAEWGKDYLHKTAFPNLYPSVKIEALACTLYHIQKLTQNNFTDLNMNSETIKLLEENRIKSL